jgi:hypothetical protein
MKLFKLTICLTLTVLLTKTSLGQSAFEQTLTGKWSVRCIPQENLDRSATFSYLCPHFIDPEQPTIGQVKSFQMTFNKDSIHFNRNNKVIAVKYSDNRNSNGFTFTLEDIAYTFKVYADGNKIILLENSGALLIMEKRK